MDWDQTGAGASGAQLAQELRAAIRESGARVRCIIGNRSPVTLDWLMRDYLVRMRHRLGQILD